MEELIIMQNTYLFKNIDAEYLIRLLKDSCIKRLKFVNESIIYDRTHYHKSLGIILKGKAEVTKDINGKKIKMSILESGDIFGAAAIFNDNDEYQTCIKAVNDCEILIISQEMLLKLFKENFSIAENYIRYLSGRIIFLNKKMENVAENSASIKLIKYLLDKAEYDSLKQVWEINLDVNYKELAALLNMGRASLYREMDALTDKGIILKENRKIRITDINKLRGELNYEEV